MSDKPRRKEIGVVCVPWLNVHHAPSGEPLAGEALPQGARVEIIERYQGRQADWLDVTVIATGKRRWIAERDRATGQRYVRIEPTAAPAAPAPRPPEAVRELDVSVDLPLGKIVFWTAVMVVAVVAGMWWFWR